MRRIHLGQTICDVRAVYGQAKAFGSPDDPKVAFLHYTMPLAIPGIPSKCTAEKTLKFSANRLVAIEFMNACSCDRANLPDRSLARYHWRMKMTLLRAVCAFVIVAAAGAPAMAAPKPTPEPLETFMPVVTPAPDQLPTPMPGYTNPPSPSPSPAPAATASPVAPHRIGPKSIAFEKNASVDVYLGNKTLASRNGMGAAPLYSSTGTALGVTEAQWFGARGTWQTAVEDGTLNMRATFTGLVPGGHYSLFSRRVQDTPNAIEPLDRSGTTGSFVASPAGTAVATVNVSQALVRGDVVLLVFRSDRADHPKTIGTIGADAHVQLRLVQP